MRHHRPRYDVYLRLILRVLSVLLWVHICLSKTAPSPGTLPGERAVSPPGTTCQVFPRQLSSSGVTWYIVSEPILSFRQEANTVNESSVARPRGKRRILYVSDPSSIAMRYLPDPVSEEDLRSWVDDLATAKVDTFVQEVYTQGWTVYWRCDRFEYDARPQHRRFLPLLEEGIQPLDVLVDQSHKNGMEFLAGLRINDNHGHISVDQGVGAGASFVVNNTQFQLKEAPPGDFYKLSTPLDFSFVEVGEFILSVMQEVISRFDVDGLEMCFRDHRYFPPGKGR